MQLPFTFQRSVHVFLALFPFVISFIRDWRGWIIGGPPRLLTRAGHKRRAIALRKTMARLGPSFIKAAQVLAMREDFLMPVYTREFKKLQDRVPSFPLRQVERLIRDNLHASIGETFERFDPQPLAAASLGQVHRARYRGEEVVVKVLRPGVQELVRTDIAVVRVLMALLAFTVDENLVRSFTAIIDEFERMIEREMDFRTEVSHAARLRENFAKDPRIRIPRFHDGLCTRGVAVLEYIDGVRIDKGQELKALGVEPAELVNLLVETYLRMAVIHGFIHADPHPGNLFVDRDRRLVILDHGMALEFDNDTRFELLGLVNAVVQRDVDAIVDGYYRLGMVDAEFNRSVLRDAAEMLLTIQITRDVTPRQMQEISQEVLATFYKFPLRLPNQLVYLLRAATLIEGIGLYYDPRFNSIRVATPVVKKLLREIAFGGDRPVKDKLTTGVKETVRTLKELSTIVHRMEREQLRIRIHEADIFELERFFNSFLRRLFTGLGLIAFVILLSIAAYLIQSVIVLLLAVVVLTILYVTVTLIPIPRGRQGGKPWFR